MLGYADAQESRAPNQACGAELAHALPVRTPQLTFQSLQQPYQQSPAFEVRQAVRSLPPLATPSPRPGALQPATGQTMPMNGALPN
jgi:hypothetical protein